jgi:hypothetical protein
LGWVEFWLAGQCQYHAPPKKKIRKNPHCLSKVMINFLEDSAKGNECAMKFATPVYQFVEPYSNKICMFRGDC